MTEEEIKDLIQRTIDQNQTSDQFAVSNTPFHTHNGADSQTLKFTRMYDVPTSYYQQAGKALIVNPTENALIFSSLNSGYSGEVNGDGTAQNLPTGWTSSHNSTGDYKVTHNLGTTKYNLVSTCAQFSAATMEVAAKNANDFNIIALNVGSSPSNKDNAFDFILLPY